MRVIRSRARKHNENFKGNFYPSADVLEGFFNSF